MVLLPTYTYTPLKVAGASAVGVLLSFDLQGVTHRICRRTRAVFPPCSYLPTAYRARPGGRNEMGVVENAVGLLESPYQTFQVSGLLGHISWLRGYE